MSRHPLDLLPLFAAGELSASESAEIELHLAGCPACRSAFDGIRLTLDLLSDLPRPEATFPDLLLRRAAAEECEALSEDLTVHAFEGGDGRASRHVPGCLRCADRLGAIRALKSSLDLLPAPRADFAALREQLRPSPFRRRLAAAAAAGLIAALAGAGFLARFDPPAAPSTTKAPEPMRAADPLAGIDSVDDAALRAAAGRLDRQNVLQALSLAEAMDDPDSLRRYAAIRLLRHLETPAAEDLLVRALGKNGPRDRILVRALVELQSPHVVPWLLTRLDDPAGRPGVLNDLARLREPSTIEALADQLPDPRVAEVLSRFDAKDLLESCRRHRNAPLFVGIPSRALHAHLAARASTDAAFRPRVLAAAADAGIPGAEFLVRASADAALEGPALALLNLMPTAILERATDRALDREEEATAGIRVVGELKLEALLPKLRRGVSSGRYRPEEALPVLARLGDLDTLIFIARLRSNERMAKAAMAALETADPLLRTGALAAAAPAEERVLFGRPPGSAPKPGRFRRESP